MLVSLYDHSNIDTIVWPKTQMGATAKAVLLPMIRDGVTPYISNVETTLNLLKLDEHLIPLTINEREYHSSYLTSNYYIISGKQEKLSKSTIRRSLVTAAGGFFKGIKINRSVLINNWLISSNILPSLTLQQLNTITQFLIVAFPTHSINFRSLYDDSISSFKQLKYALFQAREIFGYDPKWKQTLTSQARYHHRRDRRLVNKLGYLVLRNNELIGREKRICELNRKIYIDKHTKYGPAYTEKFFQVALLSPLFDFVALEKDGVIEGVFAAYKGEQKMCVPIFGYDPEHPQMSQIYRMLTLLVIDESEHCGLFLNDGTGGDVTKQLRGMQKFPEYAAIYARHLRPLRRSFWALADHFTTSPTIK